MRTMELYKSSIKSYMKNYYNSKYLSFEYNQIELTCLKNHKQNFMKNSI